MLIFCSKTKHLQLKLNVHQATGVSWMIQIKQSDVYGCCSGILMDEAGLGKTLITITLIKANSTPAGYPILIIARATLLRVWANEFNSHFQKNFRIFHYFDSHCKNVKIY